MTGSDFVRRRLDQTPTEGAVRRQAHEPDPEGRTGVRRRPSLDMNLFVSTIRRPSAAVEPSGHWKGINQHAEATCSVKPFAAEATAGTTSNAKAASKKTTYLYGRGGRVGQSAPRQLQTTHERTSFVSLDGASRSRTLNRGTHKGAYRFRRRSHAVFSGFLDSYRPDFSSRNQSPPGLGEGSLGGSPLVSLTVQLPSLPVTTTRRQEALHLAEELFQ